MVKKDKNWSYDSKDNEWYHRHTKGIWPFRKKYYLKAGPIGWCPITFTRGGDEENDKEKGSEKDT